MRSSYNKLKFSVAQLLLGVTYAGRQKGQGGGRQALGRDGEKIAEADSLRDRETEKGREKENRGRGRERRPGGNFRK